MFGVGVGGVIIGMFEAVNVVGGDENDTHGPVLEGWNGNVSLRMSMHGIYWIRGGERMGGN